MLSWFKKRWKQCVAFIAALLPSLRIFIRWPVATVSIATIPVQKWIQDRVNLGPVTSKVMGFLVFFVLLWVSWQAAEIIVILAAVAFVMELFTMIRCIQNRLHESHITEVQLEAV